MLGIVKADGRKIPLGTEWMSFPNKFVCECGMRLKGQQHSWHKSGLAHQQAQRIKALMENDCISFSEMGVRLGITRERVRQIAARLGFPTGRKRRRVCTILNHQDRFIKSLTDDLEQLKVIAERWNFTFEPIMRDSYGIYFLLRRIMLNGFLCQIGSLWHHPLDYVVIPRIESHDFDFFLGRGVDGWAVIPQKEMPMRGTLCVMGRPKILPGADSYRSYEHFFEAWQLLKRTTPLDSPRRGRMEGVSG